MLRKSERGAVAVELALVLPILLLLVIGIAEFGRAYNTQITLTQAAREGVRVLAISEGDQLEAAKTAAKNAAVSLDPAKMNFTTGSCAPGTQISMKIAYNLETITGIMGPFNLIGKGTMRCGG